VIIEQLHKAGLAKNPNGKSWVRIIIEKPYGRDLESAQKLNKTVLEVFDEPQVYRIDHYLGKDTVQNLLVLRFGNGIFEPLWNRNYVDHVQITAAETLGVEQRAAFYETAGATRDMIQSHVLQLTSLVSMEPPAAFDATAVRNEKIKVLQSIRPFTEASIKSDVFSNRGVQARARRQEGFEHRDLRRGKTSNRQLALGRCSVLSSDRQAPSEPRDRNRDSVPESAAPGVSRPGPFVKYPGAECAARRRNFDFFPRKIAWPGNEIESGDDGVQLPEGIWGR